MGRRAEAREVLRALKAYARRRYVSPGTLAAIHFALGDFNAVFAAFDRAFAAHDSWLLCMDAWPELDVRVLVAHYSQTGHTPADEQLEPLAGPSGVAGFTSPALRTFPMWV
jgi:hypothetical protein